MNQTTQASLLIRLRDHQNDDAWSSFCDIYGPLVYGYCKSKGLEPNDSADVSQEVLLRVAKAIRNFQYDRSRGRFRDWLVRIVHNEIVRWHQRRKPATELPVGLAGNDEASTSEWNQQFHQHLLTTAMNRIRDRFSQETWDAFRLNWIEDQPAPEVAESLHRTVDFVYVSKSRVLKRLRLEIELLAEDACV